MAIVQFGGGIAQMIGSHGGTSFMRTKGGSASKSRISGTHSMTPSQSRIQALTDISMKLWSHTLNDDNRRAWNLYAASNPVTNALGQPRTLSGQTMYIKLTNQLLYLNRPTNPIPPNDLVVGGISVFNVTATSGSPGTVFAGVTRSIVGANDYWIIFMGPPVSPGRGYSNHGLRKVFESQTFTASINITAAYTSIFGSTPSVGSNRFNARAYIVNGNNGLRGPDITFSSAWL